MSASSITHVADWKAGFITYFEYPGKHVTFKRVIAEDRLVVLHCFQEWPGDANEAGIGIFRFDDSGKIAEHWDVLQIVPTESANGNELF